MGLYGSNKIFVKLNKSMYCHFMVDFFSDRKSMTCMSFRSHWHKSKQASSVK